MINITDVELKYWTIKIANLLFSKQSSISQKIVAIPDFFLWNPTVVIKVLICEIFKFMKFKSKFQSFYLLVRFDSQMYPGVLREVTRIGKGLVALGTLIRLGLSHVDLCVQLQICLRTENLKIIKKNFFSKRLERC